MGDTLTELASKLRTSEKDVQLIYAFNGTGKTRLSREFKEVIDPKVTERSELPEEKIKIIYYNAFTEDLFYWDNDLDSDLNRKLIIRPNNFTNLVFTVLRDQGLDRNVVTNFQHYTSSSITPKFSSDLKEVTFSINRGDDNSLDNIKISKGEESNFIWCIFYSLLEQVVDALNIQDVESRPIRQFDELQYIFIDDPVSSLDENHLMELAVNIAKLIKDSKSKLKFIITTHNVLFFNVLCNELNRKKTTCYMLNCFQDRTYELKEKAGDSNRSFSYHIHLFHTLQEAIDNRNIEKYHFMLLRNLYEKTASFLGYKGWGRLLPTPKESYYNRVIQFTSHSTLSNETIPDLTEPLKQMLVYLFDHLKNNYNYYKGEENIGG